MSFYPESHAQARAARMREAFADEVGKAAALKREAEIAALPVILWKGRPLRTIRCRADFGRGPHDVNVPESVLWALMDVRYFLCPYHR